MDAYLRDIRGLPLLDPSEERELAIRLRRDGSQDAARRLFHAHLRLVVRIAFEYCRGGRDVMDLVQEGNVGLLKAVYRFDPHRGVKLSTYAGWWIRAYILRFVLYDLRLVKIGTTSAQRKLFFGLAREKARLAALGIAASPEVIGRRLGIEPAIVAEVDSRLSAPDASFDTPTRLHDDDSSSHSDHLGADGPPADEEVGDAQMRARLREALHEFAALLNDRERCILERRLLTEDPLTLREIAHRYGISRQRVKQVESRLLQRLRSHLVREMGDHLEPEVTQSTGTYAS